MTPNSIATKARSVCPECEADDIIKYGQRNGVQLYKCKPGGKKFTANGALPGRRIPPQIVGDAISGFYDGLSYRDIQRRIEARHDFKPSSASIYEWVRDYSSRAKSFLVPFKARTGGRWVADEMVLKVDGGKLWLWNVMDEKSRYLLATHLSSSRTIKDAETFFKKARQRASRAPETVVTDGLKSYEDGIERVFGGNTKHIVSQGIRHEINNNIAERLHGTIRERTKVMRGMETKDTAELLIDGFRIHYNHMKPHSGLEGKTPAEAADIPFTFRDWIDAAHLRDTMFESRERRDRFKDRTFRMRSGRL